MPLVGQDMDAEGCTVEHRGMLTPIQQRLANQFMDDVP